MNCRISHLFFSLISICFAQAVFAEFADIQQIYRKTPYLHEFSFCQGGGCAKMSQLSLSQADWQPIVELFEPPPQNAALERQYIAKAIGLLEQIVGNKTGTSNDRAGTFGNSDFSGQQDCNDEAINTTTYMRLLRQAGYMRFHEIEDMRTRNFFFNGWPHTTAVIHEIKTKERYAVDSWFYDNGAPATIVPFKEWKDNFFPSDSSIIQPKKMPKR
ncbi:MAG TPA: hypothetical protein VLM20_07475 [Methylophilaceae bacterium]|nr:hypothetical protein [Methylophilaceae bacterium]